MAGIISFGFSSSIPFFSTPNERYFENVDRILSIGQEIGLIFVLGVFHQLQISHITMDNARKYAEWIANRYRNEPNIIWTMYPQAKQEFVPIVRELASGLKDGDGGKHMITVHPDPSPASSSFIHKESWLAFNMIQTCIDYDLIYRMVTEDYGRKPVKPVVMAEGGYEGLEFGKVQTPLDIRRQAYWSQLAGGHYSYGHNDNWSSPYSWKSWIDSPGSLNMLIFRKIITGCQEWWNLIPDQSIFAGGESSGYTLNVAARSKSGEWILAYLSSRTTVSIKLDKITVDDVVEASWIYPITGNRKKIGRFSNEGVQSFTTPEDWEDAVCFWKLGESNDLNEFLISHYLRYKLAISFKFLVG
ncbi:MAG: apiosidase-like domain-containing protein [Thermoproteota archaeon]